MTFEELAIEIFKMTPAQRAKPAMVSVPKNTKGDILLAFTVTNIVPHDNVFLDQIYDEELDEENTTEEPDYDDDLDGDLETVDNVNEFEHDKDITSDPDQFLLAR